MNNQEKKFTRKYIFENKLDRYIIYLLRTDKRERGIRTNPYVSPDKKAIVYIVMRKSNSKGVVEFQAIMTTAENPNYYSETAESQSLTEGAIQETYQKVKSQLIKVYKSYCKGKQKALK